LFAGVYRVDSVDGPETQKPPFHREKFFKYHTTRLTEFDHLIGSLEVEFQGRLNQNVYRLGTQALANDILVLF
jgi:hypothetical protein